VKTIGWLAGIGTMLAATAYMVVSLNRWEWNRALFFGLILLVAEVGLATALVLRRLSRVEYTIAHAYDPAVRDILRATRRATPDRFAWLHETTTRMNVFITFLVGGGVLLSGVAWLVDRLAGKTANEYGEQHLAKDLQAISYPRGGLVLDDVTVLAQDVPGADDAAIRKLLRRAGHT
jgi:hypothetical protein